MEGKTGIIKRDRAILPYRQRPVPFFYVTKKQTGKRIQSVPKIFLMLILLKESSHPPDLS